jgi:adenylate cyclase
VQKHKLPPAVAEAYLDEQAREVLSTVNLYLSLIADTIKKHNGTLDKYIGDCVMAFWGAPTPNDRHALDCVRAAIDAQRAIYELNLQRAAENKRRERENVVRQQAGQAPLPMLTLLALGTGISTGDAIVGLMGSDSDQTQQSYTVFGREVNLASRLEGFSGRGRIIVSDTTYREIQRFDPDLAATCVELPPQTLKGIQEAVRVYEVQWREIDTEMQAYDTAILTGRRVTLPTDMIPPAGN